VPRAQGALAYSLDELDKNRFLKLLSELTTSEITTMDEKIKVLNKMVRNFQLIIDETEIPTTVEMQKDRFSLIADYSNKPEIRSKKGIAKFKVRFEMPQAKSYDRFSVFISEPTFNPHINFRFDKKSMQGVTPITFFAGKEPLDPGYIQYPSDNKVKVHVGQKWIFPRSGVVFVWDKLSASQTALLSSQQIAEQSLSANDKLNK